MANEGDINMDAEEEFRLAFGNHVDISDECMDQIVKLKNNDECLDTLSLYHDEVEYFSDLAWKLIGRYISNNDYIRRMELDDVFLNDTKIALIFQELSNGHSLVETLVLDGNAISVDGIRSMVPFLQTSKKLNHVSLWRNNDINNDGFDLLINSLHRGCVKELELGRCNVKDISVLGRCHFSQLRKLDLVCNDIADVSALESYTRLDELSLCHNKIGREGFMALSNLLRNENCSLEHLSLRETGIKDDEAEIIAQSLKNNTSLKNLILEGNEINELGCGAFLKLLLDISSINGTYTSNHTLRGLFLHGEDSDDDDSRNDDSNDDFSADTELGRIIRYINWAISANDDAINADRYKIISCQLNSDRRKGLCALQGINYSYGSIFSEIDPVILPNLLELVGKKYGQDELYRMLIAIVPDLASMVNKKVAMQEKIESNITMIAKIDADYEREVAALNAVRLRRTSALAAQNEKLNEELSSLKEEEMNNTLCGKKRRRK